MTNSFETPISLVAFEIQRFLEVEELFSVSSLSNRLRIVFSREVGWRTLCIREFPTFISSGPTVDSSTWRSLFQHLRLLDSARWSRDESGEVGVLISCVI